jgi:two-component system, NtrC family, response regulator HydG
MKNKRILIVEDDLDFRDALADYLVDAGYEVETVDNGLLARNLIMQTKFDLIVSDWRLPDFAGIDLLCYVRQHLDIPFVLMTGFSDFINAEDVYESGAVAYLPKPFDRRDLIMTIESALNNAKKMKNIEADYVVVDAGRAAEQNLIMDLYVRISPESFVRVAQKGSAISRDRLKFFAEQGLSQVYAKKQDLIEFVSSED